MNGVLIAANILGALGVFLVGMKFMAEALQKVGGSRIKGLLERITGNRVSGVVTGFVMTTIVQSSSATTVMVVSFVGAGLLSLTAAIGVIMGANIGTTVTGWMVALLGFQVRITSFALPAVGLGVALTFAHGAKAKQWGEVLLGFGLLFLGLSLMKEAVPSVAGGQLEWIGRFSSYGVLSTLLFVGVGTVLTVVLQSSSATMTLTLTLTAAGVIPYEVSAAMILGENIGTTATANLAALGGSSVAQRAARAHLVFNLLGVTWAIALMQIGLLPVVDAMVPGDPTAGSALVVTAHLAAFHSLFNVTNTLVMLPFVNQLAALVTRWVPEDAEAGRVSRYLSAGIIETPEIFLLQARQEMRRMAEVGRAMYTDALKLLSNPKEALGTTVHDTERREQTIDGLEREITDALSLAARAATSAAAAREIGEMSLNTHRLERIGDHCEKLVEIAVKNHQAGDDGMQEGALDDIRALGVLVDESLVQLGAYIVGDSTFASAEDIETRINAMRDEVRARYIDRVQRGEGRPIPVLWLLDAIGHLEEIGDRVYGIVRRTEATKQL